MPIALHSNFCVSYTVRAIGMIANSNEIIASSTGLILEARPLLKQLDDRQRRASPPCAATAAPKAGSGAGC